MKKFENIDLFNGSLNINPIPLEFSQSLTTTEILGYLQSIINNLIDSMNEYIENEKVSIEALDKFTNDIANFNKQFDDVRQKITEYENLLTTENVTNINSNITNLQKSLQELTTKHDTDKESIENSIDSLNTTLTTTINNINTTLTNSISRNVTNLQEQINNITTERVILIGDSYGSGYTPEGTAIKSWCELFKSIKNLSDENCYISTHGGSGFINNSQATFLELLQNVNVENPNTIDKIIVCGGYNDRGWSFSEIENKIKEFITNAKSLYPNAKVYIGHIGRCLSASELDLMADRSIIAYERCVFYNAIYINGSDNSMHNIEYFCSDGIHPNQSGQYDIVRSIINGIYGGGCSNSHKLINATISPYGNWNFTNANNFAQTYRNGIVTFMCNDFQINNISGESFKGDNGTFQFATLSKGYFIGRAGNLTKQEVHGWFHDSTNGYYNFSGFISFSDRKVSLSISQINDAHNNYYSGTITNVVISGFTMTIDSTNN